MIFRIINKFLHVFSHPDYTVGTGFSPVPASKSSRAYRSNAHHRRLGISPDPEDDSVVTIKKTFIYMRSMKKVCSNKPMIFSHHKQIFSIFSHPDYTVGPGFSPAPAPKSSRTYRSNAHHRRLGISPDPEDFFNCSYTIPLIYSEN